MYFLSKMVIFQPAMLVYQGVSDFLNSYHNRHNHLSMLWLGEKGAWAEY